MTKAFLFSVVVVVVVVGGGGSGDGGCDGIRALIKTRLTKVISGSM